jgi:outer membrane protein assembly factor BamB
VQRFLLFLTALFLIGLPGIDALAQVNQDSPWPMFRHDVKHTGRSPFTGPGQPTLQWTYPTDDGVASSPSIGADGTIYVGSGWNWQIQHDSALYALNPDGSLKWKFYTGGGIFSSPAISQDGTIYFGSFDHLFYAIEDSVTYGKLKWTVDAAHWIMNSPLISDDGSVYFGALNFKFFAVASDGDLKWEDQVGWCVFSSPALDDNGRIIVGSKDHILYAYNDLENSFNYEWTHSIGTFYDGHLIDASPAIATDGTIYFGADQFGAAGHAYDPVQIDTAFYAVNSDGSLKWIYQIGHGVESSPGIGPDGTVYFGSYDSTVYALRDAGNRATLKWSFKTNGVVDASPTIGGDGTIYIGSRDSVLYAFNPDGTILWTYRADGGIESSVTINGDGVIYFGGMDGNVYALGNPGPDVGPIATNISRFTSPDTSFSPSVWIRNYRTSSADFDVAVIIDLDDLVIYGDTAGVSGLGSGDSAEIVFDPWTVGPDADLYYNINIETILAEDLNTNNDTIYVKTSTGQPYECGDANGDNNINILDITFLIANLYQGGPDPDPIEAGDANGNGTINILDITYLIAYLYQGGPDPMCP